MDHSPPPSHYEQVVEVDKRNEAPWVKAHAFAIMKTLEGWCSEEKAAILIDLVLKTRPTKILEIGVFGGKSLVPIAVALKTNGKGRIYGIDPWSSQASTEELIDETNKNYWNIVDHEGILKLLLKRIESLQLEEQITLIRTTSEAAPQIEEIDILHVDGNHSDKTSYLDVTKWVPCVKSGGWIIFDDITWNEKGVYTTARAVEWLNTHCIKLGIFSDSCTWGIWIKP